MRSVTSCSDARVRSLGPAKREPGGITTTQLVAPHAVDDARRPLFAGVETPAFVIEDRTLHDVLGVAERIQRETGCRVLYALKPFVNDHVMRLMKGRLAGFAASSVFEATLARDVLGSAGSVHITTPGFRPDEVLPLAELCDYVALNSLPQWTRFGGALRERTSVGLRVNPQLSFVKDRRYDPCRDYSKLGVPIDQLAHASAHQRRLLDGLEGLHFHTNCDSTTFRPLLRTVRLIASRLNGFMKRLRWINMGGGYLFETPDEMDPLYEAVALLRGRYDIDVFMEPGAGLVRDAVSLVATVVDLFESDGAEIAVLDSTVNHLPEVYEYQCEPDVEGDSEEGEYSYILAGSTCLAGDVFGEYAFDAPLTIGSRVVFPRVGAYSLVKAHMFNGVNLPTVYSLSETGELSVRKRFTYEDFTSRFGVNGHASL